MKNLIGEPAPYLKRALNNKTAILAMAVFCLVDGIVEQVSDHHPGQSLYRWLIMLMAVLVYPFVLSGLTACFRLSLVNSERSADPRAFIRGALARYLPIVLVQLVSVGLYIMALLLPALVIGIDRAGEIMNTDLGSASVGACVSLLCLFWVSAYMVEGERIWRSLVRGVRCMFASPVALLLAAVWLALSLTSTYLQRTLGLEANDRYLAVFALVRIIRLCIGYACAMGVYGTYKQDVLQEVISSEPLSQDADGENVADRQAQRAGRFGWLSFLPPFPLLALITGIKAWRGGTRQKIRAGWGIVSGGMFTFFYCLLLLGALLPKGEAFTERSYSFLAEQAPALTGVVEKIDASDFEGARVELTDIMADMESPAWPYLCAQGVAEWGCLDMDRALEQFALALALEPDASEFYGSYGRLLLGQEEKGKALKMFRKAVELDEGNSVAATNARLLENEYVLSKLQSTWIYALALVLVITLHEFGHAYTAWRLGDDTAKKQGRCSLNPLVHIDLFGTIILPAILIISGSDFLFGWAKPVPVTRENLRNPEKDDPVIAFAGPAMNLLIACAAFIAIATILVLLRIAFPEAVSLNMTMPFAESMSLVGTPFDRLVLAIVDVLKRLLFTSVLLGFFNLIPMPPLDGSWILSSVLKGRVKAGFEKIRPYGFLIFLALVWTSVFDYIMVVPTVFVWGIVALALAALGFQ